MIDAVYGSESNVIRFGLTFTVTTAQAPDIRAVNLVRLGAATHHFDHNQRFMTLKFARSSSVLTVIAPLHGYEAPPGYYMLFIVDGDGVPSVAAMVQLLTPLLP